MAAWLEHKLSRAGHTVFVTTTHQLLPTAFVAASERIRTAKIRSELSVQEIAAPEQIAPHAIALGAGVSLTGEEASLDSVHGAGRLILLHDPKMAAEWGNEFRFVCYAQAPLEIEIGTDPFIADVAWSWLTDALDDRGVKYTAIAGTATKTISTGYGQLSHQPDGAQLQLRASWTPLETDYENHVEAWSELLCLIAGLPHDEGLTSLDAHRHKQQTQH
ncbi:DUF3000 domain-containing protein [Leucobacter sp. OH1287]|nr:DUF3000 domain-containing protein [Leucobacter sp. OH1287]